MNWHDRRSKDLRMSTDLLWGAVVGFLVTMAVVAYVIQDYTIIPPGVIHGPQ